MHDDDTPDDAEESQVYRFACCFKCLEKLRGDLGLRGAVLWRDICFEYILNREPIFMDDEYDARLACLEERGYVLTSEDADGDLLVKPLGYQHEPKPGIDEAFCVCHSRRSNGKTP